MASTSDVKPENPKPRIRVAARRYPVQAQGAYTTDSFQNVNQRLGLGSGSQMDGSGYNFNFISRNPIALEAGYRTSWIIGKAVDAPAEDMTKAGITFNSALDPKADGLMYAAYRDLMIGESLAEGISWGRLYGGAPVIIMIKGQNLSTPLKMETIGKGQFAGLVPMDRWTCYADVTDLVTEPGPDFGLPKFYIVEANIQTGFRTQQRVHYSRVLRFIGNKLPRRQRMTENLWGESIVERIWDRIVAFDSTTTGAAQLVFKAHLRTVSVEGYRDLIAAGGKFFEAVMQQFENMRLFQNTEGLTVLDAKDKFETHSYAFSGLDSILEEMGNQVCGAVEIPRVRLFGESPGGMGSTGNSELRTYYDDINKKQEPVLRRPLTVVLDVMARSVLGTAPPEGFNFAFNPLWLMSDAEKATIAKTTTEAVTSAYTSKLITEKVGMQELRTSSRVTGIFSNISDDDIAAAEDVIPDPVEVAGDLAQATAVDKPKTGADADAD